MVCFLLVTITIRLIILLLLGGRKKNRFNEKDVEKKYFTHWGIAVPCLPPIKTLHHCHPSLLTCDVENNKDNTYNKSFSDKINKISIVFSYLPSPSNNDQIPFVL